jgi:deoxyribodipyrimidine photo-lyase
MSPAVLHLGRHLRLDDNPLLAAAAADGRPVLPVFALDPSLPRGRHQEAVLLSALADLQAALRSRGSDLLLLHEPPPAEARECYESPTRMIADADLPFAPAAMPRTYTPFRQRIEAAGLRGTPPIPAPDRLPPLPDGVTCPTIESPAVASPWAGGETAALRHWATYRERRLPDTYKQTRDSLLGWDASSKLSPWLAWGCLSPRRVADDLTRYEARFGANDGTYWLWFELLWRDFFSLRADHTTAPVPAVDPLDPRWQALETARLGHPFVDAGVRELNATGFLGNRMRQIVASACIHDLGWPWWLGAAYFAQELVDHDPASNVGNWRYIAGQGADPRGGRHFDVEKQRAAHDPDGAYTRRWSGSRPESEEPPR